MQVANHYLKSYLNKKCCNEENIKYIENTEITNELKNMKVVVADPNKFDILWVKR